MKKTFFVLSLVMTIAVSGGFASSVVTGESLGMEQTMKPEPIHPPS